LLQTACSDPRQGNYVRGSGVCLFSLLAAGRHQELLEALAFQRFPFWHDRKFGMQALASEGRMDEPLAYAEASRARISRMRPSMPHARKSCWISARVDEAYEKYALAANGSSTGLATFRAIVRKYPGRDPKKIL
jgi:hypothetical protein